MLAGSFPEDANAMSPPAGVSAEWPLSISSRNPCSKNYAFMQRSSSRGCDHMNESVAEKKGKESIDSMNSIKVVLPARHFETPFV